MRDAKNDYINSVNLTADSDFPYLVLDVINDQSYPRIPGFQVMHWHEHLQFIYVPEGEIEIKTLDTSVQVNRGSGIFINKNVIHLVNKRLLPAAIIVSSSPITFSNFFSEAPQLFLLNAL